MQDALYSLVLALLLLTGTLLFGSCGLASDEKRPETETAVDTLYVKATLNGEKTWSTEPDAVFADLRGFEWLTISGDTTHEQFYPYGENLNFAIPFRGVATYSLMRKVRNQERPLISGTSYYEIEGDVIISRYYPTEDSSANRLTITRYDSTTGLMKGTFRTTVVVDADDRVSEPGEPPRRRPDTLRFTDGRFRVIAEDLEDRQ